MSVNNFSQSLENVLLKYPTSSIPKLINLKRDIQPIWSDLSVLC